jgi:hypothetical protein
MRHASVSLSSRLAVAVLLSGFALSAPALDSVLLEFGTSEGDEDTDRYGGAARWDIGGKWLVTGDWFLGTYLELGITYWDGRDGTTGNDSLVDFGLTPVFRWQRDAAASAFAPFAEIGLGAHGHTEDGISDEDFDIPFAFGSHVGLGARFGAAGRYEVIYRYQHLSNAGLGDENPGINFHVVQLGYHF